MGSFEIIKPSKCCPNQQVVVKRHVLTTKNADGNAFVGSIASKQEIVNYKAMVKMLNLGDNYRVKRVGTIGSSSTIGQTAQAVGSYFLPGDSSILRSPVRSGIFSSLTPGVPSISMRPHIRTGRDKVHRCPEGYQYGGRFTDNQFTTCGAKLFDIPGPLGLIISALRALRRGANLKPITVEGRALTPGEYGGSVIDSRAPQIPRVTDSDVKKQLESIRQIVKDMNQPNLDAKRMVRRDGFVLEPVVSPKVLRTIPDNRDMEGAAYILNANNVSSLGGEELGLLSNTGVTKIIYVLPGGSTLSLEKVRPLTVGERRKLGRTVNAASRIDNSQIAAARLMSVAEETGDGIQYSENFIGVSNPHKRIAARNGKMVESWVGQVFANRKSKPLPEVRQTSSESGISEKITSIEDAVAHIAAGGSLASISPDILQQALIQAGLFKARNIGNNQKIFDGPNGRSYLSITPLNDFEHLDATLVSDIQQYFGIESPDIYPYGMGPRRPYLKETSGTVYPGNTPSTTKLFKDGDISHVAALLVSDLLTGDTNRSPSSIDIMELSDKNAVVSTINLPDFVEVQKKVKTAEELIAQMTSLAENGSYEEYYRELKSLQKRQFLAIINKLLERARAFNFEKYQARFAIDGKLTETEKIHLGIMQRIVNQRIGSLERAGDSIRNILGGFE
jgi:hypothetical protein